MIPMKTLTIKGKKYEIVDEQARNAIASGGTGGTPGTDGKSAYEYAKDAGYTGTEEEFAAKLAEEYPETLPNPQKLIFTGAAAGEYNGSEEVTINIPTVNDGNGENGFSPIATVTQTDTGAVISITDINGTTTASVDNGNNGDDGESAYEYAQKGGYTGTEEQFAKKLAEEPLVGTTEEITPTQIKALMDAGKPFAITHTDSTYGDMQFNSFVYSQALGQYILSSTVFQVAGTTFCAQLFGNFDNNIWSFETLSLAMTDDIPEIPVSLKNPHALIINNTSYDGSSAVDMTDIVNSMIDVKLGVIENGSY